MLYRNTTSSSISDLVLYPRSEFGREMIWVLGSIWFNGESKNSRFLNLSHCDTIRYRPQEKFFTFLYFEMLNFSLIFSLIFCSFSGLPAMNTSSTWNNITSSNHPFSSSWNKIYNSDLILFRLNLLTKVLANSLSHDSSASTFPYI